MARAVGSRWLPRSMCVQRTRIIEETGGMHAPATPAKKKTAILGQSPLTAVRKPQPATTNTARTGSSTRRWPWASARRPSTGPARDDAVPGPAVNGSGQTAAEDLQFVPHGARQLVAELLEPLGDLRELLAPLVLLDGEG